VLQLDVAVRTVSVNDALKIKSDVVETRKNALAPYVDVLTDEKNVHVLQLDVVVKTVNVSDVLKISNHHGYTRTMGYLLSTNS